MVEILEKQTRKGDALWPVGISAKKMATLPPWWANDPVTKLQCCLQEVFCQCGALQKERIPGPLQTLVTDDRNYSGGKTPACIVWLTISAVPEAGNQLSSTSGACPVAFAKYLAKIA